MGIMDLFGKKSASEREADRKAHESARKELKELVELSCADGKVTRKERGVIMRKAKQLGIKKDEAEVILDGTIAKLERG